AGDAGPGRLETRHLVRGSRASRPRRVRRSSGVASFLPRQLGAFSSRFTLFRLVEHVTSARVVSSSRPGWGIRMVVWNEENVAHLLSRAGFGASVRDVAKYLPYGQAEAVEMLIMVPPSHSKGPGRDDTDHVGRLKLQKWWAKRMLKAST